MRGLGFLRSELLERVLGADALDLVFFAVVIVVIVIVVTVVVTLPLDVRR